MAQLSERLFPFLEDNNASTTRNLSSFPKFLEPKILSEAGIIDLERTLVHC
jgi:hypothetical protein